MLALLGFTLVAALRGSGATAATPPGMAVIPAGSYTPLYGSPMRVRAFVLDRLPVTRGDFLAFVRTQREWRRGEIDRRLADRSYLADWTSDLDAGSVNDLRRPVVDVSWFAAKAYCAARGKRLPTTAEWERAASASATRAVATNDTSFARELLSAYTMRATTPIGAVGHGRRNVFGIADLHTLVWEWTLDFDGRPAGAASHHAHAANDGHASCASAAIGAASTNDYPAFLRSAVRAGLERNSTTQTLGFRCAADAS